METDDVKKELEKASDHERNCTQTDEARAIERKKGAIDCELKYIKLAEMCKLNVS